MAGLSIACHSPGHRTEKCWPQSFGLFFVSLQLLVLVRSYSYRMIARLDWISDNTSFDVNDQVVINLWKVK